MLLFPKLVSQTLIPTATDVVIAAFAIPGQSKLKHVWMDISIVAAVAQSVLSATMYALTAYIVPVLDPDAQTGINTMWDQQIPKDDALALDTIDMDGVTTADASPEVQIGDPSIEELFNVGSRPEQIFRRVEMITFGKQSAGFVTGTPPTFFPRDSFKTEMTRNYFVEYPSMLLFGVSAPAVAAVGAAPFIPQAVQDWMQLRFMGDTAVDAWKLAAGLPEAGAESPYEDAATLIDAYLEQFYQSTAGGFVAQAFHAHASMRAMIDVEGTLAIASLSAGPG